VKELGNVLPRLIDFMAEVPAEEHIHFSKMDLADGYWRIVVEEGAQWNCAYVMPAAPDTPMHLVIPRALQMGWNKSPAYFCATTTETVRDVARAWIDQDARQPIHPMETYTAPHRIARSQTSPGPQHQLSSVYVDDFILAAVETRGKGSFLQQSARATLHAIHFRVLARIRLSKLRTR
jgi:hypothetical protein